MNGTIRRYLAEKHYGFISPLGGEAGDPEVFFHLSTFSSGEEGPPPITGEVVSYELGEGTRASSVVRLETPTAHVGTVSSYDPVKGYGFISAPRGQFYLHKSEVVGGSVPAVGSRVDFFTTSTTSSGKSPRACYVAVLP